MKYLKVLFKILAALIALGLIVMAVAAAIGRLTKKEKGDESAQPETEPPANQN